MTMTATPMTDLTADALADAIAGAALPVLRTALQKAKPRHRARVTDLPLAAMVRACAAMQDAPDFVARMLANTPSTPYEVTATKLIELRNGLDKPLLVFLPPGLRTAAEDSLDVATFQEISLQRLTASMVEGLRADLPNATRTEAISILDQLRDLGLARDEDAEARYLLVVKANGGTLEALGGALYVVGLLPDFGLVERGNYRAALSHNQKIVQQLAASKLSIQERIAKTQVEAGPFRSRLYAYLRAHARNPRLTAPIALAPEWRDLAFERWPVVNTGASQELRLILEELTLPRQVADLLGGASTVPVLRVDGRAELKVAFRSIPAPGDLGVWKTYRIQLVAMGGDSPEVAWTSNQIAKPKSRSRVTRAIRTADLETLPEGTYFLRIEAYGQDGAILTTGRPLDPDDPTGRKENESDVFLLAREETPIEPEEPRAIFVSSFTDALIAANAQPVIRPNKGIASISANQWTGTWDLPDKAAPRDHAHFALKGAGVHGHTVRMPGMLRLAESRILDDPEHLSGFAIDARRARQLADVSIVPLAPRTLSETPSAKAFLEARRSVFDAIRRQHADRNLDTDPALTAGVVETTDLLAIADAIMVYGAAWCQLAADALGQDDSELARTLSRLDLIEVRWADGSVVDPGKGLLAGPTHPVRLWWHLTHARFAIDALAEVAAARAGVPEPKAFVAMLRTGLAPFNLPPAILRSRGRAAYLERDLLTPFWSLYLPTHRSARTADVNLMRANIRARLGLHRPDVGLGTISPETIAVRIVEYLRLHPYVEQLRLLVFNPGDGSLVARALRLVERERRTWVKGARALPPDLRYAVHLVASADQLSRVGESIDALLDPDRQVGEEDEFTLQGSHHLRPKLLISRTSTDEFLEDPRRFVAHLAVLVEPFGVEVRLAKANRFQPGSYVHGLIQEAEAQPEAADGVFGWVSGLNARPTPAEPQVGPSLGAAVALTQRLQASIAEGAASSQGEPTIPTAALQLGPEEQALLRAVHEVTDQVLMIDRHLGIDYFDSADVGREVGYLLDFTPEFVQTDSERLLVTTKWTEDLTALVAPQLAEARLSTAPETVAAALLALRSLSGRLALRLLCGGQAAQEILGLMLARLILESLDQLRDRLVIPVDAHREWFADEAGGSQSRADLLVVALDSTNKAVPTFDFRVVEVKVRSCLSATQRPDLYRTMREQTDNTSRRLQVRFDPEYGITPRADRLLRAKELATMLGFYLERAIRYGFVTGAEVTRWRETLRNLNAGYRLRLAGMGIVYEVGATGQHHEEEEAGFPVFRFGTDRAGELLRWKLENQGGEAPTPPRPITVIDSLESVRDWFCGRRAVNQWGASRVAEEPRGYENLTDRAASPKVDVRARGVAMERVIPPAADEAATKVESFPASDPASASKPPMEAQAPGMSTLRALEPKILLGANEATSQFGLLGKFGDDDVGIDLTGCNTISLFGVQGFGKSYTLGVIAEMASQAMGGINRLPSPLATVIFHYHKSDAYPPEFATAMQPNGKQREVERLLAEYQARPEGINDLVILTPAGKVEQRRREFPGIEVRPILFSSRELGTESWKFLLGLHGNDAMYVRQMVAIMRKHRENLTLEALRQEIAHTDLPPNLRRLSEDRIRLAEPYIADEANLREVLRPGRTVIVDLRDEWIEKEEALGLFVVMMRTFALARFEDREFNKLVIFDEAHKYIAVPELVGQLVEVIREMRHLGTSIVIASQDPRSVPREVIELSSIALLHRMTSPDWFKHLRNAIVALNHIPEEQLATLSPGEAFAWAQRCTDERLTRKPHKLKIRPRMSHHGGATKRAIDDGTLR